MLESTRTESVGDALTHDENKDEAVDVGTTELELERRGYFLRQLNRPEEEEDEEEEEHEVDEVDVDGTELFPSGWCLSCGAAGCRQIVAPLAVGLDSQQ